MVLFIPLSGAKGNDTFYGHNPLTPSVNKETVTIPLPGGTKSLINNNTTYLTNDHLGSTRLALNTDNTIKETVEYSPFGERGESDLTLGYTGMEYDTQIGTYDYHARWYDPSIGRFDGVDSIRQSISPYSYTENNPINFIDPDGRGKVAYLFLRSMDESDLSPDSEPSIWRKRSLPLELEFKTQLQEKGMFGLLEDGTELTTAYTKDAEVKHLFLKMHGDSTVVALFDASLKKKVNKLPRDFAVYLRDQLEVKHKGSSATLESIWLSSCRTALCSKSLKNPENSFADYFAEAAPDFFPNLKKVVASPYYTLSTAYSDESPGLVSIELGQNKGIEKVAFDIDAESFFKGDLRGQNRLFEPPTVDTVDRAFLVSKYNWDIGSFGKITRYDKKTVLNQFPNDTEPKPDIFTEPAFREISVHPYIDIIKIALGSKLPW